MLEIVLSGKEGWENKPREEGEKEGKGFYGDGVKGQDGIKDKGSQVVVLFLPEEPIQGKGSDGFYSLFCALTRKPTVFMEFDIDLVPLFILCVIAWGVPMIMSVMGWGRVPTVVVEIICGVAVGSHGLDLLGHSEYLHLLALLGFIFLMFLSGLEIDIEQMVATLPRGRLTVGRFIANPLLAGLLVYSGTLVLSVVAANLLSGLIPIANTWYFALIMSTTSVGIIIPVLKNRGEVNKKFGQMMVLTAAVADIFSILLFTFTASYLKHGVRYEVFLLLLVLLVFFLAYLFGAYFVRIKLIRRLLFQLSHAASQIKVRGTMLLILLFVAVSQWAQAEVILGAFLAGVILSIYMTKDRSALMIKLDGMGYGFFIPIFFIMVGAQLDLGALREFDQSFLFLGLLILFLYLVKILPSLIWTRIFGWRRAISGGFLLSSRLSLIIAAAQIGLQLEVITPAMNAAVIIAAVATCTFSPILYGQINRVDRVLTYKSMIVGGSDIAVQLAERLQMHGYAVVVLENDAQRSKELRHKGLEVVRADGKDLNTYKEQGLKPENYVVVLTGDREKNAAIARRVRERLQHERVITIPPPEEVQPLKALDVHAVDLDQLIAASIENLVLRPSTYSALVESFEAFTVEELTVTNQSVDGRKVKELPFHKDGSLILLRRKGDMQIPHGDTYLTLGDVVTVIGNEQALEDFRQKLA